MLQPLKHVFGKRSPVRLIVFESLNKYHQFGMDRVTAGLIWCYGVGTKLSDYRERLGTNILDSVVMSLPSPNRKLLHRKLLKHSRNASIVASCLQSWINLHPEGPFASISYPGLTNHPSYDWAKDMIFHGSFLAIELKKQYQTIPTYQRFIKSVITIAKKKQIQIVAGTSFGLDTTRVYLTALRSVPTKPFIRVAVGTENRVAIGKIADLFIEVFSRFYP